MTLLSSFFLRLWSLFFFILFFSNLLATAEEKLYSPMDERNWKIGFQENGSEQILVEMIPENQDILNWKELFTVQKFSDFNLPESEFVSQLEKAFKKHASEQLDLIFKNFDPKNLHIFESSFVFKGSFKPNDSAVTNDEYNLGRVLKGCKALYYVRYSTKDPETFKNNKDVWLQRLKMMYLANERRPDREGKWLAFDNEEVFQDDKKLVYDSNIRTIINKDVRYALSIPKKWLVEEQATQETDFDETYPYVISLVFSDSQNNIYGAVAYHKKTKSVSDLKNTLRERYAEIYKTSLPDTKVIGKGIIKTILGQEAIYISLKEKEDLGWVAFFEDANTIYRIELWGLADKEEMVKTDFYKVIANFQMLEPN